MVELNVACRHRAWTLLGNTQFRGVASIHRDGNLLEVQEDVDNIFLYAFDARVLVEYAFDLGALPSV
jgi:hypothetical protein